MRCRAAGPRTRSAPKKSWPVGRGVLFHCGRRESRRARCPTRPIHSRRGQGGDSPRKRRHDLRELRTALVGKPHGHDRETQRARLRGRRRAAEKPGEPARACVGGWRIATDRASRPSGRSRSRLLSADVTAANATPEVFGARRALDAARALRRISRSAQRLEPRARSRVCARPGGCSSALLTAGGPPAALPQSPRQAALETAPRRAPQREHERILAAYNGAYDDPNSKRSCIRPSPSSSPPPSGPTCSIASPFSIPPRSTLLPCRAETCM